MPPKRRAIGRSTPQARKRRVLQASESDEQRELRLENLRVHATETRSSESSDQREVRLETDRIRTNQIRSSETTELRERRLQNVRISTARSRRTLHADLNLSAFHYDSNNDYNLHPNVVIGKWIKFACIVVHSNLKMKRVECAAPVEKLLPELHSPPEPMSTFLSDVTRVSISFVQMKHCRPRCECCGADKDPLANTRQFNAPTIDEVTIVIVGEEFESRDIILHRRSGDIQRVSETHRSYDGLQYPILFWRGDDGYHFNIK
ncbi:uncharacterized protein TNCV_3032051 [Trichonephila clavipes]|nr:uncharacterized protein TNCV_3032051 [Trichonephila clavipes]